MAYPSETFSDIITTSKCQDIIQKLTRVGKPFAATDTDPTDTNCVAALKSQFLATDRIPAVEIDMWRATARINEFRDIFIALDMTVDCGKRYLDYGCSTGVLTTAIGDYFGWDTYGTDIAVWHGKSRERTPHKFKFEVIDTSSGGGAGVIPHAGVTWDVVSCLMVLHHIPDIDRALRDIHGRMAPGGVFILREHNCDSRETESLIHVEHLIHNTVLGDQSVADFTREYHGEYHSTDWWIAHVADAGFKFLMAFTATDTTNYQYLIFTKLGASNFRHISRTSSDGTTSE